MRLAIIGPQNTGKSTLIANLIKALPEYVSSQGRYSYVVRSHGLSINQQTSKASQILIRDFLFDQERSNKEENILFDRCLIDNYVYSAAAFGKNGIDDDFLKETMKLVKDSLIYLDGLIYIPTTVSVVLRNNNIRDTNPSYVDSVNVLFIDTLFDIIKAHPLPILTLSGTRTQRVTKVKKWLKDKEKNVK